MAHYTSNLATARDLSDLALIIRSNPAALRAESRWLVRHRDAFLAQLVDRRNVLQAQFEAIDTLKPMPDFDDCVKVAQAFLSGLPP